MRMLIGHGRWLYVLALLQLLGGPLVVSMVMWCGAPEEREKVVLGQSSGHRIVAMHDAVATEPVGGEVTQGEAFPWQKPVKESTPQGKSKMQWSIESSPRIRVFPPTAMRLGFEEPSVRGWNSGAGPPAPPPKEA